MLSNLVKKNGQEKVVFCRNLEEEDRFPEIQILTICEMLNCDILQSGERGQISQEKSCILRQSGRRGSIFGIIDFDNLAVRTD